MKLDFNNSCHLLGAEYIERHITLDRVMGNRSSGITFRKRNKNLSDIVHKILFFERQKNISKRRRKCLKK